jgi:hypothetical protein
MTTTERVKALRQRRKALGLVRVELYLTQQEVLQVKEFLKKLKEKQ